MAKPEYKEWLRAFIVGDMAKTDAIDDQMSEEEHAELYMFLVAFASLMVGVRFDGDTSHEAVRAFVHEMQHDFENAEPPVKPLMVEGVIRGTLGEDHLFDEIPQDEVARANFLVITKVANESVKVRDHLEEFIGRAEELLDRHNGGL